MRSEEERQERRPLLVALGLLGGVVLLVLIGRAREELAPEPRAAHLAVEVAGAERAVTGRVEIAAGTPFTLHAVLEAEDFHGERIYYTEARQLTIGGEEIEPKRIRPWRGGLEARLLWFVVEGSTPYLEVSAAAALEGFAFREVLRPDWPRLWSIPGALTPSGVTLEQQRRRGEVPEFGSQSFHVRIELFGKESEIRPRYRFGSPGAAVLPEGAGQVTTVVARLPGALGAASSYYGLSQLELGPEPEPELKRLWHRWVDADLVFSRSLLLKRHLEASGGDWDALEWEAVELPGEEAVGAPGDLVRAGGRVVILYQDLGTPGRLDYADRALDFDRGTHILELGEVFTGDGLVERARLGREAP